MLSFERSGEVVIILVFGGIGRVYGAFVGAAVYMIAQDLLAKNVPEFWNFWIGLILVLSVLSSPAAAFSASLTRPVAQNRR